MTLVMTLRQIGHFWFSMTEYIFEVGGAAKAEDEMTAFHEYSVDFARETNFAEIFVLFPLNFLGEFLDLFVEDLDDMVDV